MNHLNPQLLLQNALSFVLPLLHGRTRKISVIILTGIALTLAGCGNADKSVSAGAGEKVEAGHESGLKLAPEEIQAAGIQVETLALHAQTDRVTVTATIRPNQDRFAHIAPRVEGRIVKVLAHLGDAVRTGQALAVLDSVTVVEAQSNLLQAESVDRVAQADYQRAKTLAADEIIPQRDYLRAKSEQEKAAAELRAAQDKLRLLGGSKNTSANSTFQLTSPLAGTIVEKNATLGELSTPNEALFTVADLSTVWIEASLTEDSLTKVRVGAMASVTVTAYPGESFAGRVTYIANLLDKDSHTIAARIEVDNKDGRLKPEMFATATIETNGASREALSVPDAALVLLQGQATVFVEEHGEFQARAIESGEKLSGRTLIKSGLAAGDKVVSSGAYALKARLLKSQIGGE